MFRLSQNNRCFQNSLAALSKNGKARFLCYQNVLGFRKESEVKSLSRVLLFATPWTVAYQAPWSMGFSRQEYWSGLLFPSPGDLPDPGIEPRSPALQADTLPSETPGKPIPLKVTVKSEHSVSITSLFLDTCFPSCSKDILRSHHTCKIKGYAG